MVSISVILFAGKARELAVLANCVLVLRQMDAERLVVGDLGMLPLDMRGELGQRRVGRLGDIAQLLGGRPADAGDFAFYDITVQLDLLCRVGPAHPPPLGAA